MKKLLSIFLVLVMVISLSACASPQSEEPDTPQLEEPNEKGEDIPNGEDLEDNEEETEDDEIDQEEETEKEAEVNIYLTSEEYVITGNEDLEKLASVKRTVTYSDSSLEEAVVRQLLQEPDSEKLINSIPDSVELIEVKVMDSTAYVDFAQDGMAGGNLTETCTIDQIVTSLLDLGTVDKVQFLIDGQVVDSLMGHVSATEPFDGRSE